MKPEQIVKIVQDRYADLIENIEILDCVCIEVKSSSVRQLCIGLRDDADLAMKQLMDLCGVDFLHYGYSQWRQQQSTTTGYSRARIPDEGEQVIAWDHARYAVVYQLLSLSGNHRLRLKVFLEPEPVIDSVVDIWPSAHWYEREAYDLFGIVFNGHPDLRRLLTDYGFNGHPFRKDFPLIGEVEMRYDAKKEACVYEPVSIQPRTLVPRVIRQDNRYLKLAEDEVGPND